MNKILLRLKIVKNGEVIEVLFDKRLCFKENFKLMEYPFSNIMIYDPVKQIFLKTDIPLKEFNIEYFLSLYIF